MSEANPNPVLSQSMSPNITSGEDSEEEIRLPAPLQKTLSTGLSALPAPLPQSEFNAQIVAALTSGREFTPWPQQALLRLRWMLIPLALGFLITILLAWKLAEQNPPVSSRPVHDYPSYQAPPLPALPASIPEPKHPGRDIK